jgi:hypothetical protein
LGITAAPLVAIVASPALADTGFDDVVFARVAAVSGADVVGATAGSGTGPVE